MKAATRLLCSLGLFLAVAADTRAAITGNVQTIGGSFTPGYVDGNNQVSLFNQPNGLALDSFGRLLVADFGNNVVRYITADEVSGTFTSSNVSGPTAVATIGSSGDVLVVNKTSGTVARFDRTGAFLGLFATNLANPTAIALDSSGNVFIAAQAGGVRRYNTSGAFIQSYAVTEGTPNFRGITVSADGTLVVSDAGNNVLWKFPIAGGSAFQFAGTFGISGFAEGAIGVGRFDSPQHVGLSTNGIVVVADRLNHRVRAVNSDGVISTLYGVDPETWENTPPEFLPGWSDGFAGLAELREPVGIAVSGNNTVFDSEVYYSVIRKVSGLTFPSNSVVNPGGGGGNPGSGGTPNRISLGYASGEASSDFFGAPGQRFVAPVTMTINPGVKMYGLQFNLMITNADAASPSGNYSAGFDTSIIEPNPQDLTKFIPVPPSMFVGGVADVRTQLVADGQGTRIISFNVFNPQFASLIVTNGYGNFVGVGWLERFGETNLYNSLIQDLIKYTKPHDYIFLSENGRVVPGAFSFSIPTNATATSRYRVSVGRASATGDGVASDVVIEAPDGSDTSLPISAVRTLNIGVRKYIVGDVLPFRWFNAGDFGDGTILNNDLEQVQEMVVYGYNYPPNGSDMFDALDSCCVQVGANGLPAADMSAPANFQLANTALINSIGYGDGVLTLEDFYVSFRRALDSGLDNYERFWQGGRRVAQKTTNSFRGTAADKAINLAKKIQKPLVDTARLEEPVTAKFIGGKVGGAAGQVVHVPVDVVTTGPLSARSLLLQFTVVNLDGGTPLTAPVTFTASSEVGAPSFGGMGSAVSFSGTWFEISNQLGAGTHRVGTVNITIPATATADALYGIKITRAEASAALTRFPTTTEDGIVWMNNRAAAPWTDEIPDSWRIQYFGSLMNVLSAPDADADGDGMTNLEEYRAGTNPNNIASSLALKGSNSGGNVTLKWPSVAGKVYRLESASALNGSPWTVVEDVILGTGAIIQRNQTLQDGETKFFRVHIE